MGLQKYCETLNFIKKRWIPLQSCCGFSNCLMIRLLRIIVCGSCCVNELRVLLLVRIGYIIFYSINAWNSYPEIFSLSQALEVSRQQMIVRTVLARFKTSRKLIHGFHMGDLSRLSNLSTLYAYPGILTVN